jgi:hypothetical protein
MPTPVARQRPIDADGIDWRGVGEFAGRRGYSSEMSLAARGATGSSSGAGRPEPVKT